MVDRRDLLAAMTFCLHSSFIGLCLPHVQPGRHLAMTGPLYEVAEEVREVDVGVRVPRRFWVGQRNNVIQGRGHRVRPRYGAIHGITTQTTDPVVPHEDGGLADGCVWDTKPLASGTVTASVDSGPLVPVLGESLPVGLHPPMPVFSVSLLVRRIVLAATVINQFLVRFVVCGYLVGVGGTPFPVLLGQAGPVGFSVHLRLLGGTELAPALQAVTHTAILAELARGLCFLAFWAVLHVPSVLR